MMALTCAETKGAEKGGEGKTINYDRFLIRFSLINMGPVASCCDHNGSLSVYMNCEGFWVSKEGLCPIEVNFGLYFMKLYYQWLIVYRIEQNTLDTTGNMLIEFH